MKATFLWCIIIAKKRVNYHVVSRRLSKTTTLCDFYHMFADIVVEQRSNENKENIRCNQASIEMIVSNSKLLWHANEIYAINSYLLCKCEFMKFASYL